MAARLSAKHLPRYSLEFKLKACKATRPNRRRGNRSIVGRERRRRR